LGFVVEAVKLLSAAGVGIFPRLNLGAVADLAGQVSWSTIVCVGLAIGTAVSRFRALLMRFWAARRSCRLWRFSLPSSGSGPVSRHLGDRFRPWPVLVHTRYLKAIEYACLGAALGWIGDWPWGALDHVAVGLVAGIFFAGNIGAAMYWTSPESPTFANLVVHSFNELLFPVGCSLVLFSAQALGKRLAAN
jgi:hypothetical protein